MAAKDLKGSAEKLASSAASFQRLLNRAIRTASPDDAVSLQRLGGGLLALTTALNAVEKMQAPVTEDIDISSLEFDVMGNVIGRKK
ncbi:MAG: hypothetical protein RIS36_2149 [Pseudomonadota bacterium]